MIQNIAFDSSDSNTSLLREIIRPRQLDPSAAAVQAAAETTTTSPLFLTADRLVTTVYEQDWYTVRNPYLNQRSWAFRNVLGEPLIPKTMLQDFRLCHV